MNLFTLLLVCSLVLPTLCFSMEMKIIKRARHSWPLGQEKTPVAPTVPSADTPAINEIIPDKVLFKKLEDPTTKISQLLKMHQSLAPRSESKQLCFARIMLDTLVINICKQQQESYFAVSIDVELEEEHRQEQLQNIVAEIAISVKDAFNNEHTQQKEDRELPQTTQFPDYATDEFLQTLITNFINSDLN